jgi:tetratricopeptide (TPR) repeat protein
MRFVGRDHELAVLRAALHDASAARGRLLFLVGDPGIGKTSLAAELADEATREGAQVLIGRADDGEGASPFWPWVQIVRGYLDQVDTDTVRRELGAGAADVADVIPDVRERVPGLAVRRELPSAQARFRFFDSFTRFLRAAARRRPLVLILDDLHWFDEPSLLLLRFLARDLSGARLLVIATYRDIGLDREHPLTRILGDLVGHPGIQSLRLRGLTGREISEFVEHATGATAAPQLISSIAAQTDGNPFFLTEVVSLLVADPGLMTGRHPASLPVSHGVRAAIGRRVQSRSGACQHMLVAAAVLGHEWSLAALEALGQRFGLAPTGEQLQGAVEEAVAAHIIAVVPQAVSRYSFTHALVREALYEELNAARRAQLHRQIAEVLETMLESAPAVPRSAGSGHILSELAYHAFRAVEAGGDTDRAVTYATRAGDWAMAVLAYEDAALQYRRALQTLDLRGTDGARQAELLTRLGDALGKAGDVPQARDAFGRAAAVARQLPDTTGSTRASLFARAVLGTGGEWWLGMGRPDPELLEEALGALAPGDSELRAQILSRLAVARYRSSGTQARGIALSQEAVEMARRIGDPATLALALHSRRWTLWAPDHLEARLSVATELARLARETGIRELALQAHAWRLGDLLELGDIDGVRREADIYARLAAELRQPTYQWWTAMFHAMLATLRGHFADAERLAREGVALAERGQPEVARQVLGSYLGILRETRGPLLEQVATLKTLVERHPTLPIWRANLAHIYAQAGRTTDARHEIELVAAHDFADLPQDLRWLPTVTMLSQACAAIGDRPRAATLYDLLRPHAGRFVVVASGAGPCMGPVSRFLGLLAGAMARWSEAQQHFQDALTTSERIGARPWVAVVGTNYARMLIDRAEFGDRDRARELLAAALETARELGMTRLQETIEKLDVEPSAARAPGRGASEPPSASRVPAAPRAGNVFRQDGEHWTVIYGGDVSILKDSKGVRYIAALVYEPEREFHVLDLSALIESVTVDPGPGLAEMNLDELSATDLHVEGAGDSGPRLDARARAAYKHRLKDLEAELEDADRVHDAGRVDRLGAEMEFIRGELSAAYGLGGRIRQLGGRYEQARKNVTNVIRYTLARIEQAHPALGRHLRSAIKTGLFCSYRPEHPTVWGP